MNLVANASGKPMPATWAAHEAKQRAKASAGDEQFERDELEGGAIHAIAQSFQRRREQILKDEMARNDASFAYPAHWTGHSQYLFDYYRERGDSIVDAAASIKAEIHSARVITGENEKDRCLRMAKDSLKRLKPIVRK